MNRLFSVYYFHPTDENNFHRKVPSSLEKLWNKQSMGLKINYSSIEQTYTLKHNSMLYKGNLIFFFLFFFTSTYTTSTLEVKKKVFFFFLSSSFFFLLVDLARRTSMQIRWATHSRVPRGRVQPERRNASAGS